MSPFGGQAIRFRVVPPRVTIVVSCLISGNFRGGKHHFVRWVRRWDCAKDTSDDATCISALGTTASRGCDVLRSMGPTERIIHTDPLSLGQVLPLSRQ